MAAIRQPLPNGHRDSSQRSWAPSDTDERSHYDNIYDYPQRKLHPKPEHRPLSVPASNGRRRITQQLQSLVRSDEERPPWAPGVWTRLPVAGLVSLIGVLLRMS
jgi:hypothetical protein